MMRPPSRVSDFDVAHRHREQATRIKGRYEGILKPSGEEIEGVWIQQGRRAALRLTRHEGGLRSCRQFGVQVDAFVPNAPTAVRAGGRVLLAYEVHVTNWSNEDMTLRRLDVLIGDETAVIEGERLKQVTIEHGTSLPPRVRTAVLVVLSSSEAFPSSIRHRLTVSQPSRRTPVNIECASTAVRQDDVVRIAPPVRGSGWWAGNGPDALHHRRAVAATDGRITVAQRFALDFVRRVPGSREFYQGNPQDNANHPSYGAEVLAVADGIVTSVKDGMPDNVPYDIALAAPITEPEDILGNHIVLDLGHSRHAVYAHLQLQSLQVRPGQKVRRGQVLGRIGNSGRSDAPHLHFHVVDGRDPLASEGIPFVFDAFAHEGVVHRGELPLTGWMIDVPAR